MSRIPSPARSAKPPPITEAAAIHAAHELKDFLVTEMAQPDKARRDAAARSVGTLAGWLMHLPGDGPNCPVCGAVVWDR